MYVAHTNHDTNIVTLAQLQHGGALGKKTLGITLNIYFSITPCQKFLYLSSFQRQLPGHLSLVPSVYL